MLTNQDRNDLRTMRDDLQDPDDRSLIRKAIKHIGMLESKLHAVRTFAKAIDKEAQFNKDEESGESSR